MVIEVKHRTSVCKMTRWFVGGAFLCSGCPSLETPADRAPVLVAAPPGPCTRLAAQTLGVPRAVSVIGVFSGVHLCFCILLLAISAAHRDCRAFHRAQRGHMLYHNDVRIYIARQNIQSVLGRSVLQRSRRVCDWTDGAPVTARRRISGR